MNLKDCYSTKIRWQDYEVGGRNYKAGFTESIVAKFKKNTLTVVVGQTLY